MCTCIYACLIHKRVHMYAQISKQFINVSRHVCEMPFLLDVLFPKQA